MKFPPARMAHPASQEHPAGLCFPRAFPLRSFPAPAFQLSQLQELICSQSQTGCVRAPSVFSKAASVPGAEPARNLGPAMCNPYGKCRSRWPLELSDLCLLELRELSQQSLSHTVLPVPLVSKAGDRSWTQPSLRTPMQCHGALH